MNGLGFGITLKWLKTPRIINNPLLKFCFKQLTWHSHTDTNSYICAVLQRQIIIP